MLKLAVVVLVVLWSGSAEAIIWEFDDGTTQGWGAKEANIRVGVCGMNLCFRGWSKTVCGRLMSRLLSPGIGLVRVSH